MDNGQFYSALGVVWVFGFTAVVLIAWHLRNRRRLEKLRIVHEERMKAMEKGIPLPEFPELTEGGGRGVMRRALGSGLDADSWNPRWPLGVGALLAERVSEEVLEVVPTERPGDDPFSAASRARTAEALAASLAELPDLYRSVIHLYYWLGLTVPEIGDVLSAPEGTVKSYLYRARAKLYGALAKRGYSDV